MISGSPELLADASIRRQLFDIGLSSLGQSTNGSVRHLLEQMREASDRTAPQRMDVNLMRQVLFQLELQLHRTTDSVNSKEAERVLATDSLKQLFAAAHDNDIQHWLMERLSQSPSSVTRLLAVMKLAPLLQESVAWDRVQSQREPARLF